MFWSILILPFYYFHLPRSNLNFGFCWKPLIAITLSTYRPSHQRYYHKIVHVKGQLHLTEPSRWFYKLAKDQITHSFVSHSLTAIRYPTKKEAKILDLEVSCAAGSFFRIPGINCALSCRCAWQTDMLLIRQALDSIRDCCWKPRSSSSSPSWDTAAHPTNALYEKYAFKWKTMVHKSGDLAGRRIVQVQDEARGVVQDDRTAESQVLSETGLPH